MRDLYHIFLKVHWSTFLALLAAGYFSLNTMFACLYMLAGPEGIPGVKNFAQAFNFSIQTFATIGYGVLSPVSTFANFVVAIESFTGIVSVALATGMIFARFSQSEARVLFSEKAVINTIDGHPQLRFRVRNQRGNRVIGATIKLVLMRREILPDGSVFNRFIDLKVARDQTPLFMLSWVIMHPIDEDSPFYGVMPEELAEWTAELVVTLTGLDSTTNQLISAQGSYQPEDIVFGHRMEDVFQPGEDGQPTLHWHHFHTLRELPEEHGMPEWARSRELSTKANDEEQDAK
ncbi:MAG: inward rectifier potassium channel [Cognaticolwellia sp.]|jgi:inward rectifier potassium channel